MRSDQPLFAPADRLTFPSTFAIGTQLKMVHTSATLRNAGTAGRAFGDISSGFELSLSSLITNLIFNSKNIRLKDLRYH